MTTPLSDSDSNSENDYNENMIFTVQKICETDTSKSDNEAILQGYAHDAVPNILVVVYDSVISETVLGQNSKESKNSKKIEVISLSTFYTELRIENVPAVNFLIDSGCALNVLNVNTFNMLNKRNGGKLNLRKTKTKVLTYGKRHHL